MAALTLALWEKTFPALRQAGRREVLADLRLEVADGERVALLGPSGCGKSTLLNIVAGLDAEFLGQVARAEGTRLAYVFQEPRLLPWRTVADNLRLVLPKDAERERRVAEALAEVGLTDAASLFASRLSLGMARRAALARAFVTAPTLLLLDEPFVSLDEPTAQRLRLLVLDLLLRRGGAAIFVTHLLREAVMMADRLVVLGGSPARIEAELAVPLSPAERRRPAAVEACRARLTAEAAGLRSLLETAPAAERLAEALP